MHCSLGKIFDESLLPLRTSIRAEMRKQGNSDSVGDVGEQFAIEYFHKTPSLAELQMAPPGTKNVDALSRNDARLSLKTGWEGSNTGTIHLKSDA